MNFFCPMLFHYFDLEVGFKSTEEELLLLRNVRESFGKSGDFMTHP